MSSSEPLPPFARFPDGLDSMGFWPRFPVSNKHSEVNGQFDHDPPSKKAKNSSDNQPMNRYDRRSPPGNPTFNQPTGRIFFKTRHCLKFRMGQCKNGENCNFAHGDEDLRKPPPNWQELVSGQSDDRGNSNVYSNGNGNRNVNENWEEDDRIIHKMKLCKKYYNGEVCPFGDECNFWHKDPPNFRDVPPPPRFRDSSRESSAISIGTTGPPMVPHRVPDQYEVDRTSFNLSSADPLRGTPRPVYWKTRRCMKFETTGYCPFGDNCHYAHGQAELLLPGGRPADSGTMTGGSAPVNHVPASVVDPAQVKTETGIPTDEGQPKKCLFEWNRTKKINRIYGDWIDDLPLILPDEQ